MDDNSAFYRAIMARPDDDTQRLVFADWLDDHGQPERAAFIRNQVELAKFPPAEHYCWRDSKDATWAGKDFSKIHAEFQKLKEAERALLTPENQAMWAQEDMRQMLGEVPEWARTAPQAVVFHRGFSEWIGLDKAYKENLSGLASDVVHVGIRGDDIEIPNDFETQLVPRGVSIKDVPFDVMRPAMALICAANGMHGKESSQIGNELLNHYIQSLSHAPNSPDTSTIASRKSQKRADKIRAGFAQRAINKLLELGADPNAELRGGLDDDGREDQAPRHPLLMVAAYAHNMETQMDETVARQLVRYGANINACPGNGVQTLLDIAEVAEFAPSGISLLRQLGAKHYDELPQPGFAARAPRGRPPRGSGFEEGRQ